MRWLALAAAASALCACQSSVTRGYTVLPEEIAKLRSPGHDGPFVLQTEAGPVRVVPETRLRFETNDGWSKWIPARTLQTDARGLRVTRSTELSALEGIRVEDPKPELLYALHSLCRAAPGRSACGAQLRVFFDGDTPIWQGRVDDTCLTPNLSGWVVANPRGFPPERAGKCGHIPGRPPQAEAVCSGAAHCPSHSWLAQAGSGVPLPTDAVSAIEVWDAADILDPWFTIGEALHQGRWFFFPNNRFNAADFEQHGPTQVLSSLGGRFVGTLGEYLRWAFPDTPEQAPSKELAAVRVDRTTVAMVRGFIEAVNEAERLRDKYERPGVPWYAPARIAVRLYGPVGELAAETTLGELSVPPDETEILWPGGTLSAQAMSSIELAAPSFPLGRLLLPVSLYVDRLRWARWSVYVWDPSAVVAFHADLGQLGSDAMPRYLIERAWIRWDALRSVQVEPPGAVNSLFGRR